MYKIDIGYHRQQINACLKLSKISNDAHYDNMTDSSLHGHILVAFPSIFLYFSVYFLVNPSKISFHLAYQNS